MLRWEEWFRGWCVVRTWLAAYVRCGRSDWGSSMMGDGYVVGRAGEREAGVR